MSEVNLSTDETRVSYGIGRQLGDQLRDNPPPGVSLDAILAGLTDAFAGKPSRVGQEEMSASFKVIREIMQAEAAAKAEAAAGEGLAFLAENAKRDGITTLASGLQFEVLTQGEGAKPTREDQRAYSLPRHPDRRHCVRQLLRSWSACRIPGWRRDRWLDRSPATDERR